MEHADHQEDGCMLCPVLSELGRSDVGIMSKHQHRLPRPAM